MAPRIEKIWSTIFSPSAVRRKESEDRDNLPQHKNPQKDQSEAQQQQQQDENQKPADKYTVEKAIGDLRKTDSFVQSGMQVEMVKDKDGFSVRLTQNDGTLIKLMSAEEFLRLRDNSASDQKPRGKILDQKF